jgi:hypothetical protein
MTPMTGDVMEKEQLKQLAQETVTALKDADLSAEIALLDSRVFSRSPEELFNCGTEEEPSSWGYKPMLELLLLHVREVAGNATRTPEERSREVRWAVETAGF